jgi:hypothetical protein
MSSWTRFRDSALRIGTVVAGGVIAGPAGAAWFGSSAGAVGAAVSLGGSLVLGAADARRTRRAAEQNRKQRDLTITVPAPDGLMIIDLPLGNGCTDPGPQQRIDLLRAYFDTPAAGPWARMFLDEQGGFPVVRGAGARLLAAAPALAEPRVEYAEPWKLRVSGHCMAPWLDEGDEVKIDPQAEPKVGDLVAAFLADDDAAPLGKWLLAPVPPLERWAEYPDAVAVLGSADMPDAMIAVPLLALDLLVGVRPVERSLAA